MQMSSTPVRVFETPEQIGAHVAARILTLIQAAADESRRFLLGLPTGRTPRPVYAAMARQLAGSPQSFAHVTLVMMDEYLVEQADGFAYAIADGAPSCHAFTRTEIVGQLNAALPHAFRIKDAQVWFPDPQDAASYDRRIAAAGGIDLFLVASGAGDGHVAFNPPGSARDSRSRVVALSEQTRRDNLATFPALGTLDRVPRFGVTVGIATIVDARRSVMVAWGEDKRATVAQMRAATQYQAGWPATLIHECAAAELVIDAAAAGQGK